MPKTAAPTIERIIDERVGEVRSDAIDFTFGEIINLYKATPPEFEIAPDFQRFFRWTEEQQSRLVESVLLELPIPQIFVIENESGVIELIDGLQRISSVIHFIEPSLLNPPNNEPLRLDGCDIIKELNGKTFADLPLQLRLRIKRSSVRTVIVKRQTTPGLKYSMFKRLNTGGSALSGQEIRNCTSRMAGQDGVQFYRFLQDCAQETAFRTCTSTLSEAAKMQRQDEELVLRFFALKNFESGFNGSISDWLDDFMEKVVFRKIPFEYDDEKRLFERLFSLLDRTLGEGAFVKYRDGRPIGGLAPAHFEAVAVGVCHALEQADGAASSKDRVRNAIIMTLESELFRANVGPGANTKPKLRARVELIQRAVMEAAAS